MMKIFTADEARRLAQTGGFDFALESILQAIGTAANSGQFDWNTTEFGFDNRLLKGSSEQWPEVNKRIVKELESRGFKVKILYDAGWAEKPYLHVEW